MAYSYDKPLVNTIPIPVAATPVKLPAYCVADMFSDTSRVLKNMVVLGVSGIVTTDGAGTISFGDGTTVGKYGVFTLDAAAVANGPAIGKLVLTEAGYELGDNTGDTGVVTVTSAGAAVIAGNIIVGYY